ncbi:MAG: phosphoglucosamine mutase [Micrococcales bacterium]|nr:MAG: phosphoglucosamine mutase [Micrococcales bacterium]PIE26405.1 MAG: phosphoglucosamine mutase [Micrococcales bacterium]
MGRLFGTDGVRGCANVDITAELALDLSVAAAHILGERVGDDRRLRAVVGRDPRASGEFLAAAVAAGLASAGVDVTDVGVLPTPAIAHLVPDLGMDLGVMLSASHNPMPDNGIKFFDHSGHKLADTLEDRIEARMREEWQRPTGADVGRLHLEPARAADRYIDHIVTTLPAPLNGLRVIADCAHGASSDVGPRALAAAGAEVEVIGARPDGLNINDGYGSTHLDQLQAAVLEAGADAGVAFDGDADRCLAVDANGAVVDGDQIMGILALAMDEAGTLAHRVLVATVMSNLGLRLAMDRAGITMRRTAVGDRYVLEDMRAGGYNLGGEQSGHVLLLDHATTGDGILTALQVLSRMSRTGRSLAELAAVVTRLPQVLVNVSGVDRARCAADADVQEAVAAAEQELGDTGRVLLRPSGTEPLVRVMVEAADTGQAQRVADELADVVRQRLAL